MNMFQGRIENLEALSGLQHDKLHSHDGNLKKLLNQTDTLRQNQKRHSEMIIQVDHRGG